MVEQLLLLTALLGALPSCLVLALMYINGINVGIAGAITTRRHCIRCERF